MAKDDAAKPAPKPKSVVSSPSTSVTIAFPFSNINMRAREEELKELVAVVTELAEHVAKLQPSPETDALVERSRAILTKLAK
jgi:hypothetical protein